MLATDESTYDEERGDHPSSPNISDDDIIEVFVPPSNPLHTLQYAFSSLSVSPLPNLYSVFYSALGI